MRIGAAIALLAVLTIATASCGERGFFRQYEYEEDMYLALDGSATIYVNASVPALNALRGSAFNPDPAADLDRDAVRAYFTTPATRVTRRPSLSRRNSRRFVHVRLDVDDVRMLAGAGPFAWSTYAFAQDGELFVYRQTVGASASTSTGGAGLDGHELVAFRMHLPSKIVYHNAGADNLRRGNILVWEQALGDRLRGEPLALEARMESQSILYRTLFLFGATGLLVALMFLAIVWFVMRRGRPSPDLR